MEFGQAAKPSAIAPVSPPPRADIVATQGSVAVDLPPEQTVQSAPAGDAVRVDIGAREQSDRAQRQLRDAVADPATRLQDRKAAAEAREPNRPEDAADTIDSRIVIEPNTRSVVVQKRDTTTGETVELVPDAATLKLRIYARQQADRNQAASEGRVFERTA